MLKYSLFTLTWLMTNDFQVEFFSFNYQKQWKLSVCKKVINQVRVNGLYFQSVSIKDSCIKLYSGKNHYIFKSFDIKIVPFFIVYIFY